MLGPNAGIRLTMDPCAGSLIGKLGTRSGSEHQSRRQRRLHEVSVRGTCHSGRRESLPGNSAGSVWQTTERSPGLGSRCHCVVSENGAGRGQDKKEPRGTNSVPCTLGGPKLRQEDEKQELRYLNVPGSISRFQKVKLEGVTSPKRENRREREVAGWMPGGSSHKAGAGWWRQAWYHLAWTSS